MRHMHTNLSRGNGTIQMNNLAVAIGIMGSSEMDAQMRNYPCDSFQRLNAPSSIFEDLEAAEEATEDAKEYEEIKEVIENLF